MKNSLITILALLSLNAVAVPIIDSKEYKVMLSNTYFSNSIEPDIVNQVFRELADITLAATNKPLLGDSYLSKIRQVRFYDVQHACTLKKLGYIFRERTEKNQSEVTLKYRHVDLYMSHFEDVSSQHTDATTKLEADYSVTHSGVWKVVYGHSTKVPNTRNINEIKDINKHFDGFEHAYQLPDAMPLNLVSGLNVYERVYKGPTVDLGRQQAEFSITLWYQNELSNTPLVAELSFKYAEQQGDFSKTVTQRAAHLFESISNNLDYIDSTSMTKTQFVYHHQPNFCDE
ncbi:hypothetical protein [Pseudoalteromonas luteoviolacea]|uniref:hypothetical protein n=1 Tax=Pseudoalteromonas luteoviolacea TaxID=43657 RepID=UPI00114DDF02|nr:hypothetical protein [Pseudoalteromonas luteoviolacea]TQF70226.1 hypothetical protein FLM44_03805 [Pseudoalteromonas luteoviolacea]